jgi:integrase
MKRLTEDQATTLYDTLKASIDPKDILIQLSFETGCRIGETLLIRPSDVAGRYVHITPLKNSKPRQVLVSENLAAKLAHLASQSPKRLINLATETRRRASERRALCRRFGDLTQRLFGERLNAHRLRHTAFTRLYAKTKDLLLVKDYAGHKSTNSTLVYLVEDRREAANEAMSQILG